MSNSGDNIIKAVDSEREELGALLSAIHENTHGSEYEVDREKLNYVVYLRKSSEVSSEKQQKSIGDQLSEIKERCLIPNKITNYTIIKEEKSAKEPDVRKKFSRMIAELRAGKYQGLIAYHPDRLARNMREAGELIDMLDKRSIKDLLFSTAYFDNTASGKMLLGMSFVLSKQYSEHLSESVLRGYRKRIEEGLYLGKMVHGYRILDDGMLEPDGENFLIMQEAFQRRLKRESNVEIAKWLNRQNYMQCFGREQKHSRTTFTDKKLSEIFRDTIYVGFLQYGQAKPVDLVKIYGFEPMIEVEDFKKLNNTDNLERFVARGRILSRKIQADILRNNVTCGNCNHKMYATTGTGRHGVTYVYFRCDYPECSYKHDKALNPKGHKHQVRAKVVVYYALDVLANTEFDLKEAYKVYVKDAKQALDDTQVDLLSQERRSRANLDLALAELEKAKAVVADPTKDDVAEYYKDDIKRLTDVDIPKYRGEIVETSRDRKRLKSSIVSEEKFLKLMQNVVLYISQLQDLQQIDEILRKFFSNLTVLNKSVSVYEFNEPWKNLINRSWLAICNEVRTCIITYPTT